MLFSMLRNSFETINMTKNISNVYIIVTIYLFIIDIIRSYVTTFRYKGHEISRNISNTYDTFRKWGSTACMEVSDIDVSVTWEPVMLPWILQRVSRAWKRCYNGWHEWRRRMPINSPLLLRTLNGAVTRTLCHWKEGSIEFVYYKRVFTKCRYSGVMR